LLERDASGEESCYLAEEIDNDSPWLSGAHNSPIEKDFLHFDLKKEFYLGRSSACHRR
jgi:hypothetical protein